MNILNNFRFKTWHFILLFAIMFVSTSILANIKIGTIPPKVENSHCIEISDKTFSDAISSNISFVLLYKDDSDLCKKMEYNLNILSAKKEGSAGYYKLNIEKYPGRYSKYNISGTPSILVFRDGKEIERIMGVVPVENLEIIYNRAAK
ncbi:thioredoxin 1 [Dysgonomonas sp. PFB1-18]|uniref:thioredoxin family protein n=1 Tax=unclassified Dysgonomonas TaxID=2630389 RepID=UPI002474CA1A|nr:MULTISPECIES: thioredoxin family protein [unclassified Dysgonomonas]MDL2302880.1 thioredoxin family protein [Dysgonomonas sp. OttesenSCG-928-D17]MDH6309593.1 thioredoxin 1 [Dysgonomonas sp. PF1-14]MDH6339079.1 thioredoxin 1 [Dysgonomonas sp. PF1-16]MDH6380635.1 thioredoxin 1 [Dysgonomonas sp. PFB1-18]MDH6398131.1 thioredoxin 1 [Dysgonomonas sp. PF1-23]